MSRTTHVLLLLGQYLPIMREEIGPPDEPLTEEERKLVRQAIGSWRGIDFNEMLDELDRIRHAHPPTPPSDLDL